MSTTTSIYGCYNNPKRATLGHYPVQDGWDYTTDPVFGTIHRTPVIIEHRDRMTLPCMYDKSATDAICSGCHRAQPAQGSQVDPSMALPSVRLDEVTP